jgi:hypothetical protein
VFVTVACSQRWGAGGRGEDGVNGGGGGGGGGSSAEEGPACANRSRAGVRLGARAQLSRREAGPPAR